MAEIIIDGVAVPVDYQKYLRIGDAHQGETGYDGKITELSEAEAAAEKFCAVDSYEECQKFLGYLEAQSFAFPQLKTKYAELELEAIAQGTGHKETALALLKRLREREIIAMWDVSGARDFLLEIGKIAGDDTNTAYVFLGDILEKGCRIQRKELILEILKSFKALEKRGLVKKYGLEQIETLLFEIAKAVGGSAPSAYSALEGLAEKGLIEKIEIENLVEIAKAAGSATDNAYSVLGELAAEGMLDKIGVQNLVEVAKTAGSATSEAYSLFKAFVGRGLIEKHGVEQIKDPLEGIAEAAGEYVDGSYSTLEKLVVAGFFDDIGLSNLIEIAKIAKADTGGAYLISLNALAQRGWIKKYGMKRLVEFFAKITEVAGPTTGSVYSSLIRLSDNGVIEKYGIDKMQGYIVEIAKIAVREEDTTPIEEPVPENFNVFGRTEVKECDGSVYYSHPLRLEGLSMQDPGGAFSAFERIVERKLIEKYGFEQIKALFARIAEVIPDAYLRSKAYYALGDLVEQGFVEKFGLQATKNLFIAIARTSGGERDYISLGDLARSRLINKIGVSGLVAIAKATGNGVEDEPFLFGTAAVFYALMRLDDRGLIEKIGPAKLVKMAKEAGLQTAEKYDELLADYTGETPDEGETESRVINLDEIGKGTIYERETKVFLEQLRKRGLAKKIGEEQLAEFLMGIVGHLFPDQIKQALLALILFTDKGLIDDYGFESVRQLFTEIAEPYDRGIDNSFVNLGKLVKGGFIGKIGISNLIAITKAAGTWTDDAYLALEELGKRGLIEKIGVARLVEIAQKEEERTWAEYRRLLKNYPQ